MRTLQRLAGHFLDVVAGLPTLKVFGRAKAQAASIRAISERYRETALSNLRVTFLSSLILELVATISVALVAVAIGLRLMGGDMSLRAGCSLWCWRPRLICPAPAGRQLSRQRRRGGRRRASFAVLARPVCTKTLGSGTSSRTRHRRMLSRADRPYPGRSQPALDDVSLHVEAGEVLALPAPAAVASQRCWGCCLASSRPSMERCASAVSTSPSSTRTRGARSLPGCRSDRTCSRARSPRTCGSAVATPLTKS